MTEEEAETAGEAGGGQPGADSNGAGIGRKRHGRAIRKRMGRRGRHLGCHLRGRRRGRSGTSTWGETKGKVEGCRPVGKPGQQVLWNGEQ